MKNKELIELINNYKPEYLYRRKDGYIDKFEVINENTVLHLQTGVTTNLDEIILLGKISENIIDLIECGDYVNGKEVVYDASESEICNGHKTIGVSISNDNSTTWTILDTEIRNVVTKQQFNQMKYIVGGE